MAQKVHKAANDSKMEEFTAVAEALLSSGNFKVKLSGKSILDQYERLQELFNNNDWNDPKLFSIAGELTEIEELFIAMREARDEFFLQRAKVWEDLKDREMKKLAAGSHLFANAK